MFTLQILDRGQSFLHSLDSAPVVIGSDPEADIRLGEAGVQRQHARVEPQGDAVGLRALGPVRVNGRAVERVTLALGDRIEIGKAVLVLGRAVTRPARPEEVLADASPARRGRPAPQRQQRAWLPFTIAGLVLAGVVAFIASGDDTVQIRNELAAVARLREAGQLEPAAAAIGRLRQQWASAQDDRLRQLDAEQQRLDTIHGEIARLTAQVLDPHVDRSYAEWLRELRRLEESGAPGERVAARQVRGVLRETLEQRPRLAATPAPEPAAPPHAEPPPAVLDVTDPAPPPPPEPTSPTSPAPTSPAPVAQQPPVPSQSEAPAVVQSQTSTEPVDVIRGEADRLVAGGLFAQALAVLQDAMGAAADPAQAEVLRQHVVELRAEALRHVHVLVAQAQQSVRLDHPEEAVALLRAARPRFPTGGDFDQLLRVLHEAEEAADMETQPAAAAVAATPAPRESGPPSALMELRSQLDAIQRAEQNGEFATAARLLHEAVAQVREHDPTSVDRLLARAETAELEAAFHDHVAAVVASGRTLKVTTRAGRAATLRSADGERLAVVTADGDDRLPWPQVSPFGLSLLVDATAPTGRAALGAAALLYGAGDALRAEALLAQVLPAAPDLKTTIDGVLARGRGEPVDERGYTFGRSGFVSLRALDLDKEAQKLAARLDAALRDHDPAARDALVTEVMAGGADSRAVLSIAIEKEFQRTFARLEASPVQKQYERLAAARDALDAAREAARSLIYDETRYVYPYQPPAVSSEQFAEYNRVQEEVDRRTAALRAVWKDDRLRVRVPATLRADVQRLDWTAKVLGQLAPFDAARLAPIEWARAVPALDSVGVQEHCRTVDEREQREQWRLVDAYNSIAGKALSSAVREQLRITNDYRAMFGHRPVAIVAAVCTAAQGHAEEMSRLGYFAHMSPVEGRRTPYDRMQLAGYAFGSSENIALCDSAASAHGAWCRSSGHHRNLLDPNHREIGIGQDGRNWVQNFGSGEMHEQDPAWQAAGAAARSPR